MSRNDDSVKKKFREQAGAALGLCVMLVMLIAKILYSEGLLSALSPEIILPAVQICSLFLPAVIFSVFSSRKETLYENFRFREKGTAPFVLASAFLLVSAVILSKAAVTFLFDLKDSSADVIPTGTSFYEILLVNVLLSAVLEEFMFRGVLFSAYEKTCGGLGAIIASSFFFAAIHFSGSEFPAYFIAGLILGTVTYITRSVFAAIVLHLINNFISLYFENTVFRIASESKSGILAIIVFAVLTLVLLMWQIYELEKIFKHKYFHILSKEKEQDISEYENHSYRRLIPEGKSVISCFTAVFFSPFLWFAAAFFAAYLVL